MHFSRKQLVWFGVVATAHLLLTTVSLVTFFSLGMHRFDVGSAASLLERSASVLFHTLTFPLLPVLREAWSFPGLWGYLPMAANSALWGAVVVWLASKLRARRATRADTATHP